MSWKMSRISSSLIGLLRETEAQAETDTEVHARLKPHPHVEDIRAKMLACMAPYLSATELDRPVWTKVLYANDIQTLWFLRSDVMHMLSDHCGETLAAAKISAITKLFQGHIPNAQFASSRRRG